MAQKKLIIYQDNIAEIGGVETALLNDAIALCDYYDLLVIYGNDKSGGKRIAEIEKYCDTEKYDEHKEYECDICIRNSLFWRIPNNIKAKKYYEVLHADYEWLEKVMTINQWDKAEKIGCGEYVAKQYEKVHGKKVHYIRNILAPKREVNKILHFITCSRLSPEKGWNRMLQMANMLRKNGIKFKWDIFTNSEVENIPEEFHMWQQRFNDVFDYISDADYLVQLSDTEGLPYSIQEALQYDTPCIVTNIGGMTELIKDGVNGYVVPLDMNFDVNKFKKIPKIKGYTGTDVKEWLDLLGDSEYKHKERKQTVSIIRALLRYKDTQIYNSQTKEPFTWIEKGTEYEVENYRAMQIINKGYAELVGKKEVNNDGKQAEPSAKPRTNPRRSPSTK